MPDSVITDPRSAYVHVPFCKHRCGYCNFTLVADRDDLIEGYLQVLEIELSQLATPREVETLFFGGGTPTHLPADQLEQLLRLVGHWFPLARDGEFSVEANPADMSAECAAILAAAGATRISLGAQSFDDAKLRRLERDHDAKQIRAAVDVARGVGASVSLDLIFGVPGETLETWHDDLGMALQLEPDHVSTYGLTFEKGTTFWNRRESGQLVTVDESVELEMYVTGIERLTSAGFEHYEVSNFAKPDRRCRHNEVYWTGGSYYAAGPGAARFVAGIRETNHRSTTTYINRVLAGRSPVAEQESLPPEAAARERIVFGLRCLDGIDLDRFHQETGFDVCQLLGTPLQRVLDADLLQLDGGQLRLTRKGLFVSDSIWPEFL